MGGNGGNGHLSLKDSHLTIEGTVKLGASGGQGSAGGNGGKAGESGLRGPFDGGAGGLAGDGGTGGTGAMGGKGGEGKLDMENSSMSAKTLVLGGSGSDGGRGGDSGYAGLNNATSQGGHGGHAGEAGGGILTAKKSELSVQSGITLGGTGGNGNHGGDLTPSLTSVAGNGGNGSNGGNGTLIFQDGVINNTGNMVLGGAGGSAGQEGKVPAGGAGNSGVGGLAGHGGDGYARFENGSGFLGKEIKLGADGGMASGSSSAGRGGKGTLLIQGGDYTAGSLQAGGALHGQQMGGEINETSAFAGEGHFTLQDGTFRTGKTVIGAPENKLTSKGGVTVTGGTMATEQVEALNGQLNVGGGNGHAALLTGTQNTEWKRWQHAQNWLENRLDKTFDGTLVVTGGHTLDLSSSELEWQVGHRVPDADNVTNSGNGFGKDSLTVVDAKSFVDSGRVAIKNGTGQISSSSQLLIIADDNLKSGDQYTMLEGNERWQEDNITSSSRLLLMNQVAEGGTTSMHISGAGAHQNMHGISHPTSKLISEMVETLGVNTQSDNQGQTLVSRASDIRYTPDAAKGATIIESAFNIANAGGVYSSAADTGLQSANLLQQRLSMTHGFLNEVGSEVWVSPIYGHRNMNSLQIAGNDTRIVSNYGGVMLGNDQTLDADLAGGALRIGGSVSAGAGQNRADNSISPTRNNFSFRGMNIFSAWSTEVWNVIADAGYSSTTHHVSQAMPKEMEMSQLKADTRAGFYTGGLRGEYRWQASLLDVTPYAGVRWSRLSVDDFQTYNSTGKVADTSGANEHFWQFPVGFAVARDFVGDRGLNVRPWLDLGYVRSTGDTQASASVKLPGVAGTTQTGGRLVHGDIFRGMTGIELQQNNWSTGIKYAVQSSTGETDHNIIGSVSYTFR
ncbi:autotransporter outer membrane beta-barrel domain-containing protein [Enterobacter ludwigii]|nr:autotransporter outer membrane beta-barrel domain-containing protein [Enterobacter ludwigii]